MIIVISISEILLNFNFLNSSTNKRQVDKVMTTFVVLVDYGFHTLYNMVVV